MGEREREVDREETSEFAAGGLLRLLGLVDAGR